MPMVLVAGLVGGGSTRFSLLVMILMNVHPFYSHADIGDRANQTSTGRPTPSRHLSTLSVAVTRRRSCPADFASV
jgi:hypothetical protein